MPTITIDGKEITVEPGTRVIEAADRLGIPIPRFCYHPGLSVAGNCRMCLVESNKWGKLVPACYDICQDGAVIKTNTPRVQEARAAVLEFILLNHPVDCPICDQAGECDLQDQFFKYSARPSRYGFKKEHKPKAKILGPHVIYDGERCINCTRCVRFLSEIVKNPQLQQINRGNHTYVDIFPGRELDNPYSLCVVDLCPVGALTSRDFRFKCRVWFLRGINTVCPECSRGCSIRVDTYKNQIQRIVPRHNPFVNQYWACDEGRLSFHRYENNQGTCPKEKNVTIAYKDAIAFLSKKIRDLFSEGKTISIILSPFLTNEDAFSVFSLFKGKAVFSIYGRPDGIGDEILRRADKNPNRKGIETVAQAIGIETVPVEYIYGKEGVSAVFLVGGEFHQNEILAKIIGKAEVSVLFSPNEGPYAGMVSLYVPTANPYQSDGTYMNEFSILQRVRPAINKGEEVHQVYEIFLDLAQQLQIIMPKSLEEMFASWSQGINFALGSEKWIS